MSEMVERVARAIYEGTPRNKPYDHLSAFKRKGYEAEARAAIEAMREPTEAMCTAGRLANMSIIGGYGGPTSWEAMIDAALASEPKP